MDSSVSTVRTHPKCLTSLILTLLFVCGSMGLPFGSESETFVRTDRSIGISNMVASSDATHAVAPNQSANGVPN